MTLSVPLYTNSPLRLYTSTFVFPSIPLIIIEPSFTEIETLSDVVAPSMPVDSTVSIV